MQSSIPMLRNSTHFPQSARFAQYSAIPSPNRNGRRNRNGRVERFFLNAAYHNARSFKGSIRYLLRSATATNHAQVDERIAELIGQGEAGYREFLRLSAVAIRPLEESLSAANVECILPDWRERSRWASLRADLADLGKGSRLGANVLLRRLLA
jgi:hypothetical protein